METPISIKRRDWIHPEEKEENYYLFILITVIIINIYFHGYIYALLIHTAGTLRYQLWQLYDCWDIKISVVAVTCTYICSFTYFLITEIAAICLSNVKLKSGRLEISWRHVFVCCRFRLFQAINNRSSAVQVPRSGIVNYLHPLRRGAIRVRSFPATHFTVKWSRSALLAWLTLLP
jgi:hypothetical protein